MLKDQLMKEAQEIAVSVELDGIFESVDFSDEVKQNFTTVFEQTVKAKAIELAESHITAIAEKADELVESQLDERTAAVESKLLKIADDLFEHTAAEWLKENAVQVERSIKSSMFESFFESIKAAVVEHDVILPENSVDVVAEMEEELEERQAETTKLFGELTESRKEFAEFKRTVAVDKAVDGLTESQKEKVHELIEGLEFNGDFETKLGSIVGMAKAQRINENDGATNQIVENATVAEPASINKTNDDANGLNYVVEAATAENEKPKASPQMNSYLAAAKRL